MGIKNQDPIEFILEVRLAWSLLLQGIIAVITFGQWYPMLVSKSSKKLKDYRERRKRWVYLRNIRN